MISESQKDKWIRCIVLITVVLLCLTGCESEAERKKRLEKENRWQEQAMKNAERYIFEKYGVQAEAVDVEFDYVTPSAPVPMPARKTYFLTVRMRTEEKEFGVYTNGDSDRISEVTRDNYQKDEIMAAIEAKAIEAYGEPKVFSFKTGDGVPEGDYGPEIHEMHFRIFYDGQNIEDVLAGESFTIKMEFINHSFENVPEDTFWKQFLNGHHTKIHCLSFRSEADRQRYHRELSGSFEYTNVKPLGLYMDYSLRDDMDGRRVHSYGLGSHDGFFYSLTDLPAEAVIVETTDERTGVFVGTDSVGMRYDTCSPRYCILIAEEYQNIMNGIDVDIYYPRDAIKDTVNSGYQILRFSNGEEGFRQVVMRSEHDGKVFFTLDTKDDTIEFAFATMRNTESSENKNSDHDSSSENGNSGASNETGQSKKEFGTITEIKDGYIIFKNTKDEIYYIKADEYDEFRAGDEASLIYRERFANGVGGFDVEPLELFPSYSGPTYIYYEDSGE